MRRLLWLGLVCSTFVIGLVGTSSFVAAYTSPGPAVGYVNDFADVLTSEQEAVLSEQVHQHKLKTSNQVAIVTVSTTAEETIEQYAVKLFEEWGIGKRDADNGALLLLAIQDRTLRIEVGYGVESVLTDARSTRIISNATPLLKQREYNVAIRQITDEMLSILEKGEDVAVENTLPQANEKSSRSKSEWIFFLFFLSFLFSMIVVPVIIAIYFSKRRGYWQTGTWNGSRGGSAEVSSSSPSTSSDSSSNSSSSSSSSSSSDSFGGGSSGGGGASGSW